MLFCVVSWKHIGILLQPMAGGNSEGARETAKKRRRLLRIAVMISVCLLLSTIATVSVSVSLDEWSRTADIALTCAIAETSTARNWAAYGFNNKDSVDVCSAEEATGTMIGGCTSDCGWDPLYVPPSFNRSLDDIVDDGAESLLCGRAYIEDMQWEEGQKRSCDCPCNRLINVERPR
jgi:hypothetical protein